MKTLKVDWLKSYSRRIHDDVSEYTRAATTLPDTSKLALFGFYAWIKDKKKW